MKKTERDKYLTEVEFKTLLETARSNETAYMLFFLQGNLGLRIGEVIRLRYVDINFRERYINIPTLKQNIKPGVVNGTIKTGQLPKTYISTPVNDSVLKKVHAYVKTNKLRGWLFPDGKAHIPDWKAKRMFKLSAHAAKLNPLYSTHALRHFKGIETYKKFKDIRAVMAILRHKRIDTSVRYTIMDVDAKRSLTDAMDTVE
jgi:integrase